MCIYNHFVIDKLFNELKASKIEKFYKNKVGIFLIWFSGACSFFFQIPQFVENLKIVNNLKKNFCLLGYISN